MIRKMAGSLMSSLKSNATLVSYALKLSRLTNQLYTLLLFHNAMTCIFDRLLLQVLVISLEYQEMSALAQMMHSQDAICRNARTLCQTTIFVRLNGHYLMEIPIMISITALVIMTYFALPQVAHVLFKIPTRNNTTNL